MTEEQRFLFDTLGYLVIPDVLTTSQLERLRATVRPTEQWEALGEEGEPLHWHPVWRELLDLPALSGLLEALIGDHSLRAARERNPGDGPALPTYRLDHINVHTHIKEGFAGGMLHGGRQVNGMFRYHDGLFYNGLLTVTFELFDTHPNDGGFCCIPGTHKSNVALPAAWRDLSQGVAACIERVAAVPGDAIVFSEALMHGTLPWTVPSPRSTIFYKYSPHSTSWGARFFDPDDYRQYADMDDRRLALLEPPNARYPGRISEPG